MQAAAQSLGMTFEVQYAQREPLKTFEIAREMVARPPGKRPEYIVITDDYAVADQLLKIIDAAGVKTFLAYSSIPVEQRGGVGSPRGKYKGWLGSLEPQAEDAGLSDGAGADRARQKEKGFGRDGKLHMLAVAEDRRRLHRSSAIKACAARSPENPVVVLDLEVYAAWTREKAAEQADWLYQRYSDARLVWAGNDSMAFGAMATWKAAAASPEQTPGSAASTPDRGLEAIKSAPHLAGRRPASSPARGRSCSSTITTTDGTSPTKDLSCNVAYVCGIHAANLTDYYIERFQRRLQQRRLSPLQQGEESAAQALRLRLCAAARESGR